MPYSEEEFDRYMREACRLASQSDSALVVAMAEQAIEDAALIDGAGLTAAEARVWTKGQVN
jgi:hypothetical protein